MSDSFQERMSGHLQDLFVLEVNTIVKSEITARPTGSLSDVLFDLVEKYSKAAMAEQDNGAWRCARLPETTTDEAGTRRWASETCSGKSGTCAQSSRTLGCVVAQIDAIVEATDDEAKLREIQYAEQLENNDGEEKNGEEKTRVVGRRIRSNCLELKRIFKRLEAKGRRDNEVSASARISVPKRMLDWLMGRGESSSEEGEGNSKPNIQDLMRMQKGDDLDRALTKWLEPADRSRIRKIGDLGLEAVLCQTRVHLDGDVVTRIAEPLLVHEERDVVMELHKRGVQRAVDFWTVLATVAQGIVRAGRRGSGKSPKSPT